MNRVPEILKAFGELLSYPNDRTATITEWLYILIKDGVPETGRRIAEFGSWSERASLGELEEAYTHTFDNNPKRALEVGWHLFGEEYARGMFLVRMREEMRRFGIEESAELPDHLVHVLQIVSAMPADEASQFVAACVLPGVRKLKDGIAADSTPYAGVVYALVEALERIWPAGVDRSVDTTEIRRTTTDPLHAFPVADIVPGCGGCQGAPEVVPLMAEFTKEVAEGLIATRKEDER